MHHELPISSIRIDAGSALTEVLHHNALIEVFAVTTTSRSQRAKLLELLGVLSRASLAVVAPGGCQGAAAAPAGHVLPARPEAELALLLVVTRLLSDVLALAAVGRQLPPVGTLAPDAAVGVLAEAVGTEADFFDALVDVDAAVAVGGKPEALWTLALVTAGCVLTLAWCIKWWLLFARLDADLLIP